MHEGRFLVPRPVLTTTVLDSRREGGGHENAFNAIPSKTVNVEFFWHEGGRK
jgi:hypothetical protein